MRRVHPQFGQDEMNLKNLEPLLNYLSIYNVVFEKRGSMRGWICPISIEYLHVYPHSLALSLVPIFVGL